jgi:DNA-binding MarR family transcriptional regulator
MGFVIISRHRVAVCKRLAIGLALPSQIALTVNITIASVVCALSQLDELLLVERLGSDAHRTRQIYGLTDYGSETWQVIDAEYLA